MKTAQDYLSNSASGYKRGGFNCRLFGDSRSETMQGASGAIWAETNAGWYIADKMIRDGKIFSEVKTSKGSVEFKCYADGDSYCCVGKGFVNLQESNNYAFGDTWQDAIDAFLVSCI